MRKRTRQLAGAVFTLVALVAFFVWPLAIDWNHRTDRPSVLGWVLFGIWFPIALVVAFIREALVRAARRINSRADGRR